MLYVRSVAERVVVSWIETSASTRNLPDLGGIDPCAVMIVAKRSRLWMLVTTKPLFVIRQLSLHLLSSILGRKIQGILTVGGPDS